MAAGHFKSRARLFLQISHFILVRLLIGHVLRCYNCLGLGMKAQLIM